MIRFFLFPAVLVPLNLTRATNSLISFGLPKKYCRRLTPIWLAASGFGPVETLRALIDRYPKDLDVACSSVSGREMYVCVVRTPLMEAVKNGKTERVRILLDAGCRVDLVLRDRFRCCKYRHLFLKPEKEVFWKKRFDTNYWTALSDAVMHRQMACLNLLLEAGANPYPTLPALFPRNKIFGPSPLDMAIRTRWKEGVEAMLNTLSTKHPKDLVRLRSFPLPYCPKSCDKEKLSIPLEPHHNAPSSENFLSYPPKN